MPFYAVLKVLYFFGFVKLNKYGTLQFDVFENKRNMNFYRVKKDKKMDMRERPKVTSLHDKLREVRLGWYGHI